MSSQAQALVEKVGIPFNEMEYLSTIAELRMELSHFLTEGLREAPLQYRVPRLSDDGSCGIGMVQNAFELRWAVDLSAENQLTRLNRLYTSLHWLQQKTQLDWLGIYQKIDKPQIPSYLDDDFGQETGYPSLVKLCYLGAPSRALFPLSETFAARSNNSTCFLRQIPILVQDVNTLKQTGRAYYECDPSVGSEICLPIQWRGLDVGIFDGEAFQTNYFNRDRLFACLALADFISEEGLLLPL